MLDTRLIDIVQNDRGPRKISPLADEERFGSGSIDPRDDIEVDSYVELRFVYRAGSGGVSPGGRVAVAWVWPDDWGAPQPDDPVAPNYLTARTARGDALAASFDDRDGPPPFRRIAAVELSNGLDPGDEVVVIIGDRSGGSPGWQAQTFIEDAHQFRFLVDRDGDGQWRRLPDPPAIRIIAKPAVAVAASAPSHVVTGKEFQVHVRAFDVWGNPAHTYAGSVAVLDENGAEIATADARPGTGVVRIPITLSRSGTHRLSVVDAEHGWSAQVNPVVCGDQQPELNLFWGDIHHQGAEAAGARSVAESFAYARDVAGVDFTAYQANDVYVTHAGWDAIQQVTKDFNQPGTFVTLLGSEWTGTPEVGGDRNTFFLDDEREIRRSSHWALEDLSDEDTDLCPIPVAYEHYRGVPMIIQLHAGGDPSNLGYHDPEYERILEIRSSHATSEWFLVEALERGYRVGVTAGSDDVMGRPGASAPGRCTNRYVRGGLTGTWLPELTREHLWNALYDRLCYGTTGDRIILWVEAHGRPMGSEFETNMPPVISVRVSGTAGIAAIDLFRGTDTFASTRLLDFTNAKPGMLRILWQGSRNKGTGRIQRLGWDGDLTLDQGDIRAARPIGFDSPVEQITALEPGRVAWRSMTAGDADGIEIEYDGPDDATFTFRTDPCSFSFQPREVRWGPKVVDAGPVGRRVTVSAIPEREPPSDVEWSISDEQIQPGINPYWVRVTQTNLEVAWSSPIYITYQPE